MKEKLILSFVWKLPKWLIYWAGIRLVAEASKKLSTTAVPDIGAMDAIKAFGE